MTHRELRNLRRSLDLRQADVANAIGVNPSCLSEYERFGKGITEEKQAALAEYLKSREAEENGEVEDVEEP